MRFVLVILLMAGPALAATEHYYVDDEEQAHEFDDGTGTYETPVPLEEIVVTAPRDADNEVMIPARLLIVDDFALWEFEQSYYVLDEGLWAEIPTPELYLTLGSEVSQGQFIHKDTHHTANATGGVGRITWDYSVLTATSGTLNFSGSGNDRTLSFNPIPSSLTRGNALHYRIEVKAEPGLYKSGTIEQDKVSILRQQYLDRHIAIPDRGSRWLQGSEIKLQDELETQFGILLDKYKKWVRLTNKTVKVSLRRESTTRSPRKNVNTKGAKKRSLHQYGCAIDISPVPTYGGDPTKKSDDAKALKDIWADSLGFTGSKGYTYISTNKNMVHVQILKYSGITQGVSFP